MLLTLSASAFALACNCALAVGCSSPSAAVRSCLIVRYAHMLSVMEPRSDTSIRPANGDKGKYRRPHALCDGAQVRHLHQACKRG